MVEWYWEGKTEVLGDKHYTAWVVDESMSMEQWWNDTDWGKLDYSKKKRYTVWVVDEWIWSNGGMIRTELFVVLGEESFPLRLGQP